MIFPVRLPFIVEIPAYAWWGRKVFRLSVPPRSKPIFRKLQRLPIFSMWQRSFSFGFLAFPAGRCLGWCRNGSHSAGAWPWETRGRCGWGIDKWFNEGSILILGSLKNSHVVIGSAEHHQQKWLPFLKAAKHKIQKTTLNWGTGGHDLCGVVLMGWCGCLKNTFYTRWLQVHVYVVKLYHIYTHTHTYIYICMCIC